MGEVYPELLAAKNTIEIVLKQEEEQFARTLEQGLKRLEILIAGFTVKDSVISGKFAFELYDTYGFPIDLTMDIARENNCIVDTAGFEQELLDQKERSKKHSSFKAVKSNKELSNLLTNHQTEFTGYDKNKLEDYIIVTALLDSEQNDLNTLTSKDKSGYIVSAATPFYAEGGGQVGDQGVLCLEYSKNSDKFSAEVINTIKINKTHLHQVIITSQNSEIKVGDKLLAKVDKIKRLATERNHSATHLLHAALRKILGPQVVQKGSYVGPEYLRFDFAYYQAVSKADLESIEQEVNTQILNNNKAELKLMAIEEALESGAMALFGEKYDEKVRVLNFGSGYSVELCGGTHVMQTGDIGLFIITSESSAASGIRRIEALTGDAARYYLRERENQLKQAADLLKTSPEEVLNKIKQLQLENNKLIKEATSLKQKQVSQHGKHLVDQAIVINGVKVLVAKLESEGINEGNLRSTLDQLKTELQKAVILLAVADFDNNKVSIITGVTNNCTDKVHAGKLINMVAMQLDGKGGGRPDMAQAGGRHPEKLDAVLTTVVPWLENILK
jgi:alanyl-tRNA synthetase